MDIVRAGAVRVTDARDWAERNLPIDDPQHCNFCGSPDWSWVFPLREVPTAKVTWGSFACACQDCHKLVEVGDDAGPITRHGVDDEYDPYSFEQDLLPAFHAARSGEPLTRATSQSR